MDMLLSIKPRYVRYIRNNQKFVELRKSFPRDRRPERIFVYESFPVKRICGWFAPREICVFPLEELWKKTKSLSCVTESDFQNYYQGKTWGTAIFFDRFLPMPAVALQGIAKRAPQSYAWLTASQSAALDALTAGSQS